MGFRFAAIQNFFIVFMFVSADALYGQIAQSELKKELWKTIDPMQNRTYIPNSVDPKTSQSPVTDHDVMYFYNKLKYEMPLDKFYEEYRQRYYIDPHVYTYNGEEPINKIKAGYLNVEFMGGHFQPVASRSNLITPSGLNLSGGGKKHISERTKRILKEVYGVEVED